MSLCHKYRAVLAAACRCHEPCSAGQTSRPNVTTGLATRCRATGRYSSASDTRAIQPCTGRRAARGALRDFA